MTHDWSGLKKTFTTKDTKVHEGIFITYETVRYAASYAVAGRPVMRIPEWPLWRMLRPISSAVICSRMRAFSSLPPSMARTPGILRGQSTHDLAGVWIVAAYDHVALDGTVGVQQFRSHVLKSGHDRNSFGYQFGGLLRGGALPDAESAGGAASDARG